MDFLQETRWLPSLYNRHYHERKTAVAMETIDQLSTYIYVYVAGVQLHTSPIARGYRKLIRAIRIFAFVARLAIRKD